MLRDNLIMLRNINSEDWEGIALVPAELFEEKMRALSGMAATLQEK